MKFEKGTLPSLLDALAQIEQGFTGLPDLEYDLDKKNITAILLEVAERLQDNYPYFHPFYAGQMLKPPHPIARLAYMLGLWINPNNHALDGGRASSYMEREAVAELAAMIGWKNHLGHLCSGGTMANLEALWVAGKLNPGKTTVASDQAHYTHHRICDVLQLPFQSIPCDSRARMDLNALERLLKTGKIGTVVATLGTTATGSVDPLREMLKLKSKHNFRLHADAAYGGYFVLLDNLRSETRTAFDLLHEVDSVVIDPHKHGLQPYGAGCVLFKDPAVGIFYKHDSPYTYFSSSDLHLGEISLECSRPGAAAIALWATQRLLPLVKGGTFANDLARGREAALKLFNLLRDDERFLTLFEPELDIVVWAPRAKQASEISERSRLFFQKAADADLHLALANFPAQLVAGYWPGLQMNQPMVTCLRSCLMKPEHLEWLARIWDKITDTIKAILKE
jgi:tyrosine decarboxylase/aspartate 1-decarboxylase